MAKKRASQNTFDEINIGPWVTGIAFLTFVYFSFHLLHGHRGYFAVVGLETKIAEAEVRQSAIEKEHDAMQQKVTSMRPTSLDLDMLDEQIRNTLGYARKDEIIVISE